MSQQSIENPRAGKTTREVQAAERDYLLGKSDIVPFSNGKTVAEARDDYRKAVAKQDTDLAEKRKAAGIKDESIGGTMPLLDKKEQSPMNRPAGNTPNTTSGNSSSGSAGSNPENT